MTGCVVTVYGPGDAWWLDVPDGSDPDDPVWLVDGLSVAWGRSSVWDQPDAATVAFDVHLGPPPWPSWVSDALMVIGNRVTVAGWVGDRPPEAAGAGLMFGGVVTDVALGWPDGSTSPVLSVGCVDYRANAESDVIGAAPFPVESAAARLARLEGLSSVPLWCQPRYGTPPLTAVLAGQDVDAQPWAGLVETVAVAVDAAAWPVTTWRPDAPQGVPPQLPGLMIEPVASRPVATTLHMSGGLVVVGPIRNPPAGVFDDVSACLADRDGVAWGRAAASLLTRVSVAWIDTTDPDLTEHTQTVIDAVREQAQGVRGASITTTLTTAAAASALASAVLARSTPDAWELSALLLDSAALDTTDPAAVDTFNVLLRSGAREGRPVKVTDLPAWNPAGDVLTGFVEGGQAVYSAARWVHEIGLSSVGGTGTPARWSDLPAAWRWVDFAADVQWFETAVPAEGP